MIKGKDREKARCKVVCTTTAVIDISQRPKTQKEELEINSGCHG